MKMRNMRLPSLAVISLLMASLVLSAPIQVARAQTLIVDASGSGNYNTIQDAVNAAIPGDTIEVMNGVYSEKVVISTNNLIIHGQSNFLTIVQGGFRLLQCDHTTISGFRIVGMNHLDPNSYSANGVEFGAASFNTVTDNYITDCSHGLYFVYIGYVDGSEQFIPESCESNIIAENNIVDNYEAIWFMLGETNNKFYHNNFIDNEIEVDYGRTVTEIWDDGYPSGGNYWSDYTGADAMKGPLQDLPGSDGIIDTPYQVTAHGPEPQIDNYPLVAPWGFQWDSVFVDSHGRETTLKVNTASMSFDFSVPGKDYGVKQGASMLSHGKMMTIRYEDDQIRIKATIVYANVESCQAVAWDLQTGEMYHLMQ
jgi:hypothetical protein